MSTFLDHLSVYFSFAFCFDLTVGVFLSFFLLFSFLFFPPNMQFAPRVFLVVKNFPVLFSNERRHSYNNLGWFYLGHFVVMKYFSCGSFAFDNYFFQIKNIPQNENEAATNFLIFFPGISRNQWTLVGAGGATSMCCVIAIRKTCNSFSLGYVT